MVRWVAFFANDIWQWSPYIGELKYLPTAIQFLQDIYYCLDIKESTPEILKKTHFNYEEITDIENRVIIIKNIK